MLPLFLKNFPLFGIFPFGIINENEAVGFS